MFDLNSIAVDPAKVAGGVWWRIWRSDDGYLLGEPCAADSTEPRLLIVPIGVAFERAREEALRPVLERVRSKTITDDELREIDGRVLAQTAWRGAANLGNQKQGPWTWTEDGAAALLNDPGMIPLRRFVERAAGNLAAAAAEEEAKAQGN